jgi:fructokinase
MIATIGEALVDLIERADGSFQACLGGSICNFTLALARQSVATTYLNPLSADRFGDRFAALLADAGVVLGARRRSPHPTSLALVSLDREGVPSYAFYRGKVADRDVDGAGLIASLPDRLELLHTGSLALVAEDAAKILTVLRAAAAYGAIISLDANLRLAVETEHDTYCQWVRRAMGEAHIVKLSDEDLDALALGSLPLPRLQELLFGASRTQLVALTHGGAGATLLTRRSRVSRAAPARLTVVDTVGAGDCFHAGLIAFLKHAGCLDSGAQLATLDPELLSAALEHAIASASINVTRVGCDPPRWGEVSAFKARMKPAD